MKKLTLLLLVGLFMTSLTKAQVVITEIMYNPPESGTDSLEYIELLNTGNNSIDVSGWNFTQGFTYVFPAGTSIGAGQYVLIAKSPAAMQNVFNKTALAWGAMDALTNGGEDIELRDANGTVMDYVDYKNVAPWPLEANGQGASLVLCDPASDNSLPVNWQAAQTPVGVTINGFLVKANPGAASGCTGGNTIAATNDFVTVTTGIQQNINVLSNDLLPNPVTSVTIQTPPAHGTATVNADNTISYVSNQGFCGNDTMFYRVCDASNCSDARVALQVKCYTPRTLAEIAQDDADGRPVLQGESVKVTGTVYGYNLRPTPAGLNLLFTIIDDAGNGVSISSSTSDFGYTVNEKDKLEISGTVTAFNGLTSIIPDVLTVLSTGNTLVSPAVVQKADEGTESRLIKINGLSLVDPAEWTTGVGGSGFNVRAVAASNPNDTILIRIDRDVQTYNAPVPAQPFDLTGLGGQFDNSAPFTSGYQVLPRYNADISTLSSTHQADFSTYIKVSPNPATDFALVQMTTEFDRLILLSPIGQKLTEVSKPSNEELLPLRNLSAGTYFLRFEKGRSFWVTKLVKH